MKSAAFIGGEFEVIEITAEPSKGRADTFVGIKRETAARDLMVYAKASLRCCGLNPAPAYVVTFSGEPRDFDGLGLALAAELIRSLGCAIDCTPIYIGAVRLSGAVYASRGSAAAVRALEGSFVIAASASEAVGHVISKPATVATVTHVEDVLAGPVMVQRSPAPAPVPVPRVSFEHLRLSAAVRAQIEEAVTRRASVKIISPPGAGTTLVARLMADLITMSPDVAQESASVTDIAGLPSQHGVPVFRAPHHTASLRAIMGTANMPGEAALAHGGVLYLDELREFNLAVTRLSNKPKRIHGLPSDFMLVASVTPCPCGYRGSYAYSRMCSCTDRQIASHNAAIDRRGNFDMTIVLEAVNPGTVYPPGETTSIVRGRIETSRNNGEAK